MNREELVERLEMLVRVRIISIIEAQAIVELFDNGDITDEELPLPYGDVGEFTKLLDFIGQRLFSFALLGRSFRSRIETSFDFIERHNSRAGEIVSRLTRQDRGVRNWHRNMSETISVHLVEMATFGNGRILGRAQLTSLEPVMLEQASFLARFADELAFRRLIGRPMSQGRILDRSRQYASRGIEQFYRFMEGSYIRGVVVDYIPVDDGGTCFPCHSSGLEGPYLPGQGPFPGLICVAKGKCRCRRVPRFDIATWRALRRMTRRRTPAQA